MVLEEQHRSRVVVVAVGFLAEAMALVREQQVPDRLIVAADGLDDLLGFRVGHAGVVLALGHEQRCANLLRIVSGEMRSNSFCMLASRSSPYSARRRSRR